MNAKHTVELIEKKTIHIRMLTDDTKRVTVAVRICANGTLLPLMLVYKGGSQMAALQGRSFHLAFTRLTTSTIVSQLYGWTRG